ncbi:DUF6711 family protein [Suilimivivens sp.]|uniref:DUF6711 family protein n=1 Tax=Suilimivivens sp. TaxID=2981669 RepID=UPI00307CC4AE
MAYGGYLIRFGSYTFPDKYIDADSVKIAPGRRQDLNSTQDANGILRRNALDHTRSTVQFSTGKLYESEMEEIMTGITGNYLNEKERDAQCSYYDTEYRCYRSGHMYLDSNMEWTPCGIAGGEMVYGPVTFVFTEY